MEVLDKFLKENKIQSPDDIDFLLECAALTRNFISKKQYDEINNVIRYTIRNNFKDALVWVLGIIQEEIVKDIPVIDDFFCNLGGQIINYDETIENLQIDFNSIKNYIEKIYDENGEVCAFFNVMVYKTLFDNIFLISSENFDNKDNDYIQYKLAFVKDTSIYN